MGVHPQCSNTLLLVTLVCPVSKSRTAMHLFHSHGSGLLHPISFLELTCIPPQVLQDILPVTPGCQIQESQGLQLVLVQMIIRTQQSAIVNVQLFQTNLFQYKGGLCTSHATWYGSQI